MRLFLALALVFVLIGCGKNEPFPPFPPGGGFGYAPAPPNGGYPAPNGFNQVPYNYPSGGFGNYPYGGGFNPWGGNNYPNGGGFTPNRNGFPSGVSTGSSNGFYPYLPVYDWMRRDPSRNQYWNQMWNGWLGYCQRYGYHQNNFHQFWTGYLVNQRVSTQPWYRYFDSQFYPWMTRRTQFPAQADPRYFWQFYGGAPWQSLNTHYLNSAWTSWP